ncbi:MAG TPA: erythrose-4-phosphate dehydrogenase, partial [Candidatus Babeliales bacterium]|nr:erythrose-4-phosphate dehydrogenase [Candidatus Babeliales bacterium]
QVLLDDGKQKFSNSRAAALNCIPSTTGASKVIGRVMPELDNKVVGSAVRIPVAEASLLDIVFTAEKDFSVESINQAFKQASNHIIGYNDEPLVSSDYNCNPHSAVMASLLTQVQGGMGKVSGWYDNEWAYCQRLKDFLLKA